MGYQVDGALSPLGELSSAHSRSVCVWKPMWDQGGAVMINAAKKRGQIIKHLEEALALAGGTGFLIERGPYP